MYSDSENLSTEEKADVEPTFENPLIINIRLLPFAFAGVLPKSGKGPYGLDTELITLKPVIFNGKCVNKTAEICLVSGFPVYKCFFHAFIHHSPKKVLSYNTFKSGITARKLRDAPHFLFVRNQLEKILKYTNPLLVGCNINSDLKALEIFHKNVFDLHSFFYEFNKLKTGTQPISLRRIVYKFFDIDIQRNSHNCITDAHYSVKIYEEIFLNWETIRKKFSLEFPPFAYGSFLYPS